VADAGQVREEERDPREEARRLAALAQLRQHPDPVLRMRAQEVEAFDDDLERLVERMKLLMDQAYGVGLAGNQVGVLRRVFVFQRDEDDVVALVNPVITKRSEEVETDTEGCLSLREIRVPVERATAVTIEGRDPDGADVRYELEGLPARVVQHEVDHLDGVLILDRTDDESRRQALAALRPRPVLGVS
jgi:peptide deformylase